MNIKAIISLAVTLVIGIAAVIGVSLDEGIVTTCVCGVAIVADIAYSCWKNHNFTAAAQSAQGVLDAIKDGSITVEEVEDFVGKSEDDGQ